MKDYNDRVLAEELADWDKSCVGSALEYYEY